MSKADKQDDKNVTEMGRMIMEKKYRVFFLLKYAQINLEIRSASPLCYIWLKIE